MKDVCGGLGGGPAGQRVLEKKKAVNSLRVSKGLRGGEMLAVSYCSSV